MSKNDDGDTGEDNNNIAMKDHAKKESLTTSAGGSIIDITHTPDVAVWAKEVRRGTDKVETPSKTQSISTKPTTNEKLVDPADKSELAGMANRDNALTDEANISSSKNEEEKESTG